MASPQRCHYPTGLSEITHGCWATRDRAMITGARSAFERSSAVVRDPDLADLGRAQLSDWRLYYMTSLRRFRAHERK